MPPTTEQDSKVMGMVLKALNDLKSDMGTVKKILNISDGTKTGDAVYPKHKSGHRVNEKREKTRNRFAGAIAKGTKVPKNPYLPPRVYGGALAVWPGMPFPNRW